MGSERANTEPVLQLAWRRYAALDAASKRGASLSRNVRRTVLVLGVLTTLFAVLSFLFPRAGSEISAPAYMTRFCAAAGICNAIGFYVRVLLVSLPVLSSLLAALALWLFSQSGWLVTRAGAEKVLNEIYFYRTILRKSPARHAYLEQRLGAIAEWVNRGLKREFNDRRYRGRIPPNYAAGDPSSDPGFSDLSGEGYFRYRLEEQLAWHTRRANRYRAERARLQLYIVLSGAAGAFLVAFNSATLWVALSAALTAAFVSWLDSRSFDPIIRNYGKVILELTMLHDHWLNLEPEERTEAEFHRMVLGCEDVLAAQNAQYIQSMQDVLQDPVLEREASLVQRVMKEAAESAERVQQSRRDSLIEYIDRARVF